MIELESITVQNFGPYLDEHSLDFGGHQGVYVIYGNIGHGKTSFLHAFRWAFTGQTFKKTGTILSQNLINRDAIKNSDGSTVEMCVTVKFQVDGTSYEVLRKLARTSEGGLRTTLRLVADGNVLSKEDAPKRLGEILPAEIQQFFFFDAELISDFEFLIDHKSLAASRLKESIEVVLGIPVLRGASVTLRRILDSTLKDAARRGRQSKTTEEIATQIEQLQGTATGLEKSIDGFKKAASDAKSTIQGLENQLKDHAIADKLIKAREEQQGLLKGRKETADLALESLQDAAEDSWKATLRDEIDEQIKTLKKRETKVAKDLDAIRSADFLTKLREKGAKTGTCPCCGQDHPKSKQERDEKDGSETSDLEEELQRIRSQGRALEGLGIESAQRALADAVKANNEAQNGVSTVETAIVELKEKLVGIDVDAVSEVVRNHSDATILYDKALEGQGTDETQLSIVRENLNKLQRKLIGAGTADMSDLTTKTDLVRALSALFEQAADAYREDQKSQIETAATRIFKSVATDEAAKDYKELRITETYGLEIMHVDGTVEDLRSSGYEHIVAVSLIGALQEISLVNGPVVMDSPVMRLDELHAARVLELVPRLARQVLLLVTDREIAEGEASKFVDPSEIIAERKLKRITARQTVLEPLGGGSR